MGLPTLGPRHDVIDLQVEAFGLGTAPHAPEVIPPEHVSAEPQPDCH